MLQYAMMLGSSKNFLKSLDDTQKSVLGEVLRGLASSFAVDPETKPLLNSAAQAALKEGDIAANLSDWMSSREALEALQQQKKLLEVDNLANQVFVCPHCGGVTSADIAKQ